MPKIIDVEGVGEVEVPDNMSNEDIVRHLNKQFFSPSEETVDPETEAAIESQEFPGKIPLAGSRDTGEPFYKEIFRPISNLSFQNMMEAGISKVTGLPRTAVELALDNADPVAKGALGAGEALTDTVNAMTSPAAIATIPVMASKAVPSLAKRAISGAFAVDMGRHVPGMVRDVASEYKEGDVQGTTRAIGNLMATAGFTALAAKHALTSAKKPAPLPMAQAEVARLQLEAQTPSTRLENKLSRARQAAAGTELPSEGRVIEAPDAPPTKQTFREIPILGDGPKDVVLQPEIIGAERVRAAQAERKAVVDEIDSLQRSFKEAVERSDAPAMGAIQSRIIELSRKLETEVRSEKESVGFEGEGDLKTAEQARAERTGSVLVPEFKEGQAAPLAERAPAAVREGGPEPRPDPGVVSPESLRADESLTLWDRVQELNRKSPIPERPTEEQLMQGWLETNARLKAAGRENPTMQEVVETWVETGGKPERLTSDQLMEAHRNAIKKLTPEVEPVETRTGPRMEDRLRAWVQRNRQVMGPEARTAFDAAIERLEGLKVKGGKVYEATLGIPVTIWNGSVSAAQMALRAGKSVAEAVRDGVDWVKKNNPGLKFDEGEFTKKLVSSIRDKEKKFVLQDFKSRELEKAEVKPFGAGEIPVIGKLFDPRANVRNPQHEAVLTHAQESGKGKAFASVPVEQVKATWEGVWPQDELGRVTNIKPKKPGQSLHLGDVISKLMEDPNAYEVTPEQRVMVEEWIQIEKEITRLENKYEIFEGPDGEYIKGKPSRIKGGYFPRVVTKVPPAKAAQLQMSETSTGAKIGGKQFFQKQRKFVSEEQGVKLGYRYEQSPVKRLATRLERLYKAIADKRLYEDPALKGVTKEKFKAEAREFYAEELGSGRMTEAEFDAVVDSAAKDQKVPGQPAFFGKIYDKQTVAELRRAFPNQDNSFRKVWVQTGDVLKGLKLGYDWGVGQIQGLTSAFDVTQGGTQAWAKAQAAQVKAFTNKKYFSEWLSRPENLQAARELAEYGSPIGRLPEMLSGLEPEGILQKKIPGIGKAGSVPSEITGAFGRSFQTFLDISKIELWKARRNLIPKEELGSAVQGLESNLTLGRMESIGLSSRRSLLERALLLAPTYYRGAVNQVALLFQKGVTGDMARRSMASYLVGGSALYVAMGMLAGMSEEEIFKRFNPTRSDFMMVSWKNDKGETVNFGLGGIYRSFMKLMAKMATTSVENPRNWISLDTKKNPLVNWYRAHAAPIPSLSMDAFTGKDFLGRDVNLLTMLRSSAPLAAQKGMDMIKPQEGDKPATGKETVATFFGLTTFPLSDAAERSAALDEVARKKFNKGYEDLGIKEMLRVNREVEKLPQFEVTPASSLRQKQAALEASDKLEKRLNETVEAKDTLKELGLRVTGFKPSFDLGNTTVHLTDKQEERYEEIVVEEYNRILNQNILSKLANVPISRRQEILNKLLTKAREIAKKKLIKELR